MKSMDEFYKGYEHDDPGNKYRLKELVRFIPDKGCRILDVGCGSALKSVHFKKRGNYLVGIDISMPQIDKAQKLLDEVVIHNFNYSIPFKDEEIDLVYCANVLEHILDFRHILIEIWRVLKRGGRCVIEVPNVAYWPGVNAYRTRVDLDWTSISFSI